MTWPQFISHHNLFHYSCLLNKRETHLLILTNILKVPLELSMSPPPSPCSCVKHAVWVLMMMFRNNDSTLIDYWLLWNHSCLPLTGVPFTATKYYKIIKQPNLLSDYKDLTSAHLIGQKKWTASSTTTSTDHHPQFVLHHIIGR